MSDETPQGEHTETPAATKADKKHPCLCSKLDVLVNVREGEHGGLVWDEEHTTGCDPEVLTSKTFRPGHDAKAVSFLLKAHEKGWEVSLLEGGTRSTASPELIATQLGDALFEKYNKAAANQVKKAAAKQQREAERAARREEAKKAAERPAETQNEGEGGETPHEHHEG